MTFLVFREFECCSRGSQHSTKPQVNDFLVKEYVSNISKEFRQALIELCNLAPFRAPHPDFADHKVNQVHYPYLWWFHARSSIQESIQDKETLINPKSLIHLRIFQKYLDAHLSDEWAAIDLLLSTGYITAKYIRYLFVGANLTI